MDVGCGEGQASVFFAKNSYTVSAFDISENGINKAERLANEQNVEIDFFCADINTYIVDGIYHIVYGSGILQYIRPNRRQQVIQMLKKQTAVNGIHIFNVFVDKPFMETPPDWEEQEWFWKSGELMRLYADWKIEKTSEDIFECGSNEKLNSSSN